jgi:uncharacterized protein (DUF433 family)
MYPGKVSAPWVHKGSRMAGLLVSENLEAEADIDDIREWVYGLDREQVKALIEFTARTLDRAPE